MADFSDSLVDESIEAEGSREGVEPDRLAETTPDGIELEEFHSRLHSAEITDA